MRIEKVEWLDAHSKDKWTDKVMKESYKVVTVGFVLYEDATTLNLVQSLGEDGHYAQSCIPVGCIVKREIIGAR